MRLLDRLAVACVVTLAVAAHGAAAQDRAPVPRGMIDGAVTDSSLVPLAGATISVVGSSITATTNDNGRFRIVALPAGEYMVTARRIGYATASAALLVEGGDTLRPSFALSHAAAELDTMRAFAVHASTRLSEFEERRAKKIGHFITAEQIERQAPTYVGDALERVLSVKIKGMKLGERIAMSMRNINPCPFAIFVDGMIFSETGDVAGTPSPKDIAGIEVYSGPASIPLEYKRHDTMCGAILIWTKGG